MSSKRLQIYRALATEFEASLAAFQSSKSQFRVLKTVNHISTTEESNDLQIQEPDPPKKHSPTSPRTIYILDSSFNPPSIAHRSLALSALSKNASAKNPRPSRLLLLFAVLNADKAGSSPATFPHRLTMMTIFAQDLLHSIYIESKTGEQLSANHDLVPIDIGVTKAPYYTDKSIAITSTPAHSAATSSEDSADEGLPFYPDSPKHVHLLGFDTLTRFFNPKYYKGSTPPLSAIAPYFDAGHALRATLRPGEAGAIAEESEGAQRAWWQRLADGEMEDVGGRREWAGQVELVEPNERVGVSSTKIRKAAQENRWDEVQNLCCDGVQYWIKGEGIYDEKSI